jgi:hypothetical protein
MDRLAAMPLADLHRLATAPVPHPSSVVTGDRWRITLLTPRLVRLEWAPTGEFEDRATQVVLNRDFPAHEFTVVRSGDGVRTPTTGCNSTTTAPSRRRACGSP